MGMVGLEGGGGGSAMLWIGEGGSGGSAMLWVG